jgi:hypothetical protein
LRLVAQTLTRASSTPGRGIEISPIRKLEGGPGLSRRTAFMKFDPIFVIRFFT